MRLKNGRELIRDAARWRLRFLNEESKHWQLQEKSMRLDADVKEMGPPLHSASGFIHKQVDEILAKYGAWFDKKRRTRKKEDSGKELEE